MAFVLSSSPLSTVASRVPESSVSSPLAFKRVAQWQLSSVLVARRISDVKAEKLTDTSGAQFAHAFKRYVQTNRKTPTLRRSPDAGSAETEVRCAQIRKRVCAPIVSRVK